jgi:hypothetical protein
MEKNMTPYSDFKERKAVSSLEHLIDYAKEHPLGTVSILNKLAHAEGSPCYPDSFAAIYLLGMVFGICAAATGTREAFLENIKKSHQGMLEKPVTDYMGSKRKFGLGSQWG